MATKIYPNALRFDVNVTDIKQLTQEIIDKSKKTLDGIVSIPLKDRNFKNTVHAMDTEIGEFSTNSSTVTFPAHVSTSKELRDASNDATNVLSAYEVEKSTREDLYKALLDYKNTSPEAAQLKGEQLRLLEKAIERFERSGLGLSEEKKNRMKEVKKKMSELAILFSQNLNEDNTKLQFTKQELDGLPEDFFEGLPKTEDGKYTVSLKYPELFPIMEHCKVESTRKAMDFANSSKCMEKNTPLMKETLVLRQEEAQLLGYGCHADFELAIRMAKNTKSVMTFLEDLTSKLEKPALRDLETLRKLKVKTLGSNDQETKMNGWDWRFFDRLLMESEYQIDHNLIKEYFPLDVVTKGILEVYQGLLSLNFEEIPKEKVHVWHEDVKQYSVHDKETKAFIGHFYLDLHPREGKYGHAAEFDLVKGYTKYDGSKQHPASAMVANFTKPTPTKPSLLTFSEVETYFHEFGHCMHEICSTATFWSFSGTHVERDFVEAPSQMLENWVYQENVLKMISAHYKTGENLPNELRERLVKCKYVNEALKNRRQLMFGTFDMKVHTMAPADVDLAKIWAQCQKEIALTEAQPGTNGAAGFGHIMGGYSAGYYGYLWSKVYSCDMFNKFQKEGVMNPTLGRKYRDSILAVGGSRDASESIREFLGRDPTPEAFLLEIGAN